MKANQETCTIGFKIGGQSTLRMSVEESSLAVMGRAQVRDSIT
jgi:hypothetical protein